MIPDSKPLVRLAVAIHAEIASATRSTPVITLPVESFSRLEQLVRRVRRAELHGWHLAAAEIRDDLRYYLRSAHGQLSELLTELGDRRTVQIRPRVRDLYQDLAALKQEFESVSYCRKLQTLSVTTEPITLEGVYLGPFEIRLPYRQLSARTHYRIVALEPHPAASRPGVTHPHVMDEALCAGEAHLAIRRALADGRLLDFFLLVAGVLRHYNAESPFVAIELWKGCACDGCGCLVDEDDWSRCQACRDLVCDDCAISCGDCGETHCHGCLAKCPGCQDSYCRSCLGSCGGCRRSTCQNCLQDERCQDCHENQRVETDQDDQKAAEPAVHADGLGQTVVSA